MSVKSSGASDLLRNRRVAAVFWWLPITAVVGLFAFGSVVGVNRYAATAILGIAFALIGAGCTLNAIRCGRTHCYFTGPFFLLLALASLLQGLEVIGLGWGMIGTIALVGGIGLTALPDWLLGRYRWRRRAASP